MSKELDLSVRDYALFVLHPEAFRDFRNESYEYYRGSPRLWHNWCILQAKNKTMPFLITKSGRKVMSYKFTDLADALLTHWYGIDCNEWP